MQPQRMAASSPMCFILQSAPMAANEAKADIDRGEVVPNFTSMDVAAMARVWRAGRFNQQ